LEPLLAIADLAGGDWPTLARTVAEKIGGRQSEQSSAVMLLEDVKQIFTTLGVAKIFTKDLINELTDRDDRHGPSGRRDTA
jgi:putative DNA primase/helicase